MSTAPKSHLEKQVAKKRGRLCPVACAGGTAGKGNAVHIMPGDDVRRVPGQNWLVLSYATPDGTTRVVSPRGMVMKFSGCFDKPEQADAHAEQIRNEDPRFDVYVVKLYTWGMVPLPDDEKPFIRREYADKMLTRIVSGLQNSMEQGKKEMEERKERDRKRAEEAMRRATKNPDYVMPEKSDLLIEYEDKARKVREDEKTTAAEEGRAPQLMHSEQDIMDILMRFCVDRAGRVIDAGTGADLMKYFIEKTIERDAQLMRAQEREKPDEDPKNLPSHDEVARKLEEKKDQMTQ